ncbi:MAG: hypothetical protein RSF69_01770 [Erysipelotrichaceae bacterium]
MYIKIKAITISFGLLFLSTFLFSLLIASLYYHNLISPQFFILSTAVSGMIAYSVGGFYLGQKINKKALLHALFPVSILCLLSILLMPQRNLISFCELFAKLLAYLFFTVLAKNLHRVN